MGDFFLKAYAIKNRSYNSMLISLMKIGMHGIVKDVN